jgi:protein-L-isoaspartate O-methyltransferase
MSGPQPPDDVMGHYEHSCDEATRLQADGDGTMGTIRTLEILGRYLPDPPARILDVGGGPGYYSRRLTTN